MKVSEIVEKLELEVITDQCLEKEVTGAYTGDLLSNVMARAESGDVWITIQGHQNVVAVALLAEVAAVVIVENFDVERKAIARAKEKEVNILRTPLSAYEVAGKLYKLGIT